MAAIVAQAVNLEPPRIVALLVPQSVGAARSTQSNSLAATGGTGPAPRPVQKTTLLARPQVALAGGFALPVPLATVQATALLALSSAARVSGANWLIAGVVQAPGAARPVQQQTQTSAGTVVWPHPGAAQPRQTQTLAAQARTAHPLVALACPLYAAYVCNTSTLDAGGLVRAVHCYRSAHGLHGGRYAYRSSGGDAMGAQPLGGTPQTVALRTQERDVPFNLSFAPDVSAGDSITSAVVTVLAQPAPARLLAAADVTSTMLRSQQLLGTSVLVTLGNANATLGTRYLIRVVAHLASGVVLQETIGDGQPTYITCDE